jgi:hypothetical protein
LFIVLSLATACLFLMGFALAPTSRVQGGRFERVAMTIGLGILINYALVLTGQPLGRVLVADFFVGLLGAWRLSRHLRAAPPNAFPRSKATILAIVSIIYLVTVYSLQVLSEPLSHWDARSIWFFHARMIWIEGALRSEAAWTHPSIVFSHPDYPMLVPALAAQLASLKGYWNEYFPQASLVVMLVPLVLWVFSFRRRTVTFILLVLAFFFSLGGWLWNGYMDGYLVLYGGAALLSFGRYLSGQRIVDLCSALVASGIASNLKNEGLLFAVCFAAAVLVLGLKYPECTVLRLAKRLRGAPVAVGVLLLSMAPAFMWMMRKRAWGIESELTGDPVEAWARLSARLFDGATPEYLLNYLVTRSTAIWMVAGLVVVIAIFLRLRKLTLHPGAAVAALTAVLYGSGLYAVYLSTPHNFEFHVSTSGTRTMATASMALLVSMFFLLSSLEVDQGQRAQPVRALEPAS